MSLAHPLAALAALAALGALGALDKPGHPATILLR